MVCVDVHCCSRHWRSRLLETSNDNTTTTINDNKNNTNVSMA